jgi:hypothetical protein
MLGFKWTSFLVQNQCSQHHLQSESLTSPGPGFSVLSLMELLHQAPFVIPQIIMSLRTILIATCNKLCEIMMPFYGGNKTQHRINVTTDEKTFNWLFDTGAAITCMNANIFRQVFQVNKPKLIQKGAGCVTANRSKMNSLGVFEVPMTIRGRQFLHPVTVIEDINDNMIGIDFMHTNKMNYNATSKQITFAHMLYML